MALEHSTDHPCQYSLVLSTRRLQCERSRGTVRSKTNAWRDTCNAKRPSRWVPLLENGLCPSLL